MSEKVKKSVFDTPLFSSKIKSARVKLFPEAVIGYFLGPFGALLASGIFTSFLNRYWTDILFANYKTGGLLPPSVNTFLTLLPLLSAVLIVAGNLAVGQLIERTHTKAGKARPWLLLSSLLLSVSCILLFVLPMGNGSDTPVLTMTLTAIAYNLYYSVAYPLYSTANSTLVPVSTRNSNRRGLLASFSNFASVAVMGAGGMVFPMIIAWFLGGWETPNKTAWTVAFVAIAVVTFLFTVLQYYFTRERVTEEGMHSEAPKSKISVKKQLKGVASDKFWWIVIIFFFLFQFSGMFKNLSITYFCTDRFSGTEIGGADGAGAMAIINILGAVPMAVAMTFIWPLSAKFGKKIVVLAGCVLAAVGGVIAGLFPDNFYAVAVGVCLKSFGSSPACYMVLALISDVLDHIEAKRGYRCDGLTMSIYSSILAASTPIATGLFNLISGGGANAVANTICYIWIETVAYAVCAVLMVFFSVEKYMEADKAEIRERQKALALANGEEWIEPEERLRLEEEEAERQAEEARKAELKAKCEKKGLDFEEEESKYQAAREAKRKAAEEKKAKREAKKK